MNIQHRLITFVTTLITLFVSVLPSNGWDNIHTHPFINRHAFDLFNRKYAGNVMSNKYKLAKMDYRSQYSGLAVTNLGGTRVDTSSSKAALSIRGWVEHGGMSADEPEWEMALRHFYDPLRLHGVAYLTDHVGQIKLLPKIDAVTWALTHPENVYSMTNSLKYYKLAMENVDYTVSDTLRKGETVGGKREQLFAAAFRGIGEVMHLVADMSNPAHVRNDSHPYFDVHEGVVSELLESDGSFADSVAAASLVSGFEIGQNPRELFDKTARFVNTHLLSNETIMNDAVPGDYDLCDHYFNMVPANWEARYPSPLLHQFDFQKSSSSYGYPQFRNRGPLNMVQSTYSSGFLSSILKIVRSRSSSDFSIPAPFVEDQALTLLPIGIHTCAKMLDLFFPTMKVKLKLAQDETKLKVSGSVTHEIGFDSAWKALCEPIVYSGPARLMCQRGRRFAQVATLTFAAGRIDPEPTVYFGNPDKKLGKNETKFPFKPGDQVFIEVPGGGMTWRSPEEEVKIDILGAVRACKSVILTIACEMEWSDKEAGIKQILTTTFLDIPLQWSGTSFSGRGKKSEVGDGSPYSGNFIPKGQEEFTEFDCEGRLSSDGARLDFLDLKVNTQNFIVSRVAGTFANRRQINEQKEALVQNLPWSFGTTYEISGSAAPKSFRSLKAKSVEKLVDSVKDAPPPPNVEKSLVKIDIMKPIPDTPLIKVFFTRM